jgi:hypothetical protein
MAAVAPLNHIGDVLTSVSASALDVLIEVFLGRYMHPERVPSPYFTRDTLCLRYRTQPVNAV